jgi:hypothetical protein
MLINLSDFDAHHSEHADLGLLDDFLVCHAFIPLIAFSAASIASRLSARVM